MQGSRIADELSSRTVRSNYIRKAVKGRKRQVTFLFDPIAARDDFVLNL